MVVEAEGKKRERPSCAYGQREGKETPCEETSAEEQHRPRKVYQTGE